MTNREIKMIDSIISRIAHYEALAKSMHRAAHPRSGWLDLTSAERLAWMEKAREQPLDHL